MGAPAGTARRAQARPQDTSRSLGIYRPRRPRASPLYRLIEDHFQEFSTVYEERFARRYGYWRSVIADVVDRYLACGILKHGFARVRCGACKHEYLLAFSCKCRYFCPSCRATRLALWGLWLEEILLAPVPHRQVVLTVARVASHIPDKGQVLQRYYGWYASRTRGTRRQAGTAEQPIVYADPVPVPLREARRCWAELLRRIF